MITVEICRKTLEEELDTLMQMGKVNPSLVLGAIAALDWVNSGCIKPSEFIKKLNEGLK